MLEILNDLSLLHLLIANFQPQQQPDGLVAGSLDLLTMLLKASDSWKEECHIFTFFVEFRTFKKKIKNIIIVLHCFANYSL